MGGEGKQASKEEDGHWQEQKLITYWMNWIPWAWHGWASVVFRSAIARSEAVVQDRALARLAAWKQSLTLQRVIDDRAAFGSMIRAMLVDVSCVSERRFGTVDLVMDNHGLHGLLLCPRQGSKLFPRLESSLGTKVGVSSEELRARLSYVGWIGSAEDASLLFQAMAEALISLPKMTIERVIIQRKSFGCIEFILEND